MTSVARPTARNSALKTDEPRAVKTARPAHRRRPPLFLARDRLGIKPLYYSVLADGTVLFGSELKALLQHPDLPRNIDPRAIEDYFAYGYVPDPKTIYRDVAKLAPAHYLTFRRNEPVPSPRSYWDLSFEAREGLTEAQACEELVEPFSAPFFRPLQSPTD